MKPSTVFILLAVVVSAGCTTVSPALDPVTQRQIDEQAERDLQARIIDAVRKQYGSEARIVVESRSPTGWRLRVGPETVDTLVEVDPASMQIVRVWPGY